MELPVGRMQRAATESLVREVRQIFSWSDEPLALRCSQELWNSIGALLAMVLKYMDEQDADLTAELFCLVVEFKGIVAESLCLARERRFAVLYPQYRKDLEHLAGLRRQLQGTFREVFRGIPDNAEERLANHLRAQKRELEETLRKGIPELRPQPPSVPELARALDDLDKDSVLIDLTRLPSDSHLDGWAVFILPAGSPGCLRMIELSAGPAISEALVIFVKSLLAEADSCAPAPDYQPLWTLLWSPIETVLAELRITLPDRKLSRLFVSQDGILNCLPFQVLRNPQWEEGRYLIDEYEITYLTTARDLFNLPDIGAHPGRRPLALGLCNFSGDPSQA